MKNIFFAILLFSGFCVKAQQLDGYWYGVANVENGGSANNYMIELVLKQNGNTSNGVINYYFKNTFRSFKLNGTYNPSTRQLVFYNIPVTYFGSSASMEVDCPMDIIAQLRVSQVSSILRGRFVSKGSYKYTCPELFFDLKLNKDASNQDSILTAIKLYKETFQVWSPSGSDTSVAYVVQQKPVVNYVVTEQYKQRTSVIEKEVSVESDSIRVDFFDNGEIDGDSISVFFNDQLLTFNRLLSSKSIQFNLALDKTKEVNEVGMFANNLGSIPPNTALMVVYDGKKRYEVRLSSSMEKNAIVRIRRKIKN